MALTDFDLEVLLNEAMEDNAVPSEELNKKLKKKVRNKSIMKSFHIDLKSVAAVVLVVAAVGAFSKNGTEIKNTKTQLAGHTITTDSKEQLEKKLNENSVIITAKKEEKIQNVKTPAKNITKKSTKKPLEKTPDNINFPMVAQDDIMLAQESQIEVAAYSPEVETIIEDTEEKNYKYIEIAADGIGKALDELNETVNSYIDGIYNKTEEYPMIASARMGGAENEEEMSEYTSPECSYEVLYNDEKYLSVCIKVKTPDDGQLHTKCYTVDKESQELVTQED